MNVEIKKAYAVVTENGTEIATVSETQRAAKVNWLVVACRIHISRTHSDNDIDQLWNQHHGEARITGVEVSRRVQPGISP